MSSKMKFLKEPLTYASSSLLLSHFSKVFFGFLQIQDLQILFITSNLIEKISTPVYSVRKHIQLLPSRVGVKMIGNPTENVQYKGN